MKRICALLPLALLCGISAAAQEKPVVTVSPDRLELSISLASGGSLPERFAQTSHKELGNYRLHELEPEDEPGAITRDRTPLLDATGAPQCAGFNCTGVRLRLTSPLAACQTFILAIDRFTNAGSPVTARFTTKAAPATPENAALSKGPDVYEQRSQLTLRSKSPVTVAGSLVVHRKFYRLTADQTGVEEDSEVILANVNKKRDTLYVLDLYRKLTEGQDLDLYVADGITDGLGQKVRAEGKLKLAGVPTKPEEIRLDMNLATAAAVKQKAVFDLTAKYVPTRVYQVGDTEWIWEPTVTVDLGLRSTKSANSVVLAPLAFSNHLGENSELFRPGRHRTRPPSFTEDRDGTEIPIYADWAATPWYRPSDIKLTTSPLKAEFDRNFKRKNLLGSLRFDLNVHRWRATVKDKLRILEQNFGEDVVKSMRADIGWSLVPYLSFDAGGHVNNETVANKKKQVGVFVPRHKIFRAYAGFTASFESSRLRLPLTLTIDESVFYLAAKETVGFTTDTGVGLRQLKGFHHRGVAKLSFALDPAKHYSLAVTYENGRLAPNFEYLNKLTAGFRLAYW